MNVRSSLSIALAFAIVPASAFAAPRGGFDFHGERASSSHPQSATHSSTGPAGTNRTTTVNQSGNGYNRTTTATNGNYNRTTSGGANTNGNYYHNSSGSSPYGSYNRSASGNAYNHTYSSSASATNAWGQTYHSGTYASNGVVYHGATVTNPVYHGGVWGWNGGYAWYPAPYYYGGGFWGAFAIGAATAAAFGAVVAANSVTYNSYQVAPQSPGAKLLASYHLTQTPCGPPNLVVIYGPNNSVICAHPNNLVGPGNYSVNSQTLTLVSEKP